MVRYICVVPKRAPFVEVYGSNFKNVVLGFSHMLLHVRNKKEGIVYATISFVERPIYRDTL